MTADVVVPARALCARAGRMLLVACAAVMCLTLGDAARAAVIFDQTLAGASQTTGKDLAAHVVFDLTGSTLKITATNTGAPAEAPGDVLTGIFWNLNTPQTLIPASVDFTTKTGSNPDQLINIAAPDALGKHWQYRNFTSPVQGETYGLGASGLAGTFSRGNFSSAGTQLQGADYGIVDGLSPHANRGTNVPLVSRSLTFTLNDVSASAAADSALRVADLRLQYGTNLSEASLSLPEPGALGLLLLSASILLRRRTSI